jgi:hypothetical protein
MSANATRPTRRQGVAPSVAPTPPTLCLWKNGVLTERFMVAQVAGRSKRKRAIHFARPPASCLDLALVGSYGQPETSYDELLVSEQLKFQQVQ